MVKRLILQHEKFTITKKLKISRLEAIQRVQDFCARPIIKRVQETIKGTERASPIYTLFHR